MTLDVGVEGELPTAFRLFRAGPNETTKGTFLFDDEAARAVLAAFDRDGVDLPIDLAHDSLSEAARAARDDADDARGWFRLDVRDGELWAVGVTWTEDGVRRLRARTQRYISPAFATAKADGGAERVVKVVNCALVSMPATLDAVPLVASRTEAGMDPKLIKDALDALEAGDSTKALEILKSLIASAAGAPVEETTAPADPTMESADPPPAPALARRDPATEAELVRLRTSVATLEAERVARELDDRRDLVARLVVLGAETPATAWAGDAAERQPCDRLAGEPLVTLRARVEALTAARPADARRAPPARGDAVVTLSDVERRVYDRLPSDAARSEYLARRTARKAG